MTTPSRESACLRNSLYLRLSLGVFIYYLPLYIFLVPFFFLAGFFTTRKTQRASSGRLAGVIVGGVFLLTDVLIGNLLLDNLISFPQMARIPLSASALAQAESILLGTGVPYSLVAGSILIGVGAVVGALGGQAWKQGVSWGILVGLIVGGLYIGALLIGALIIFSEQPPLLAPDLTSLKSALFVFGFVVLIGIGGDLSMNNCTYTGSPSCPTSTLKIASFVLDSSPTWSAHIL